MSDRRVVVTGLGAITSLGHDPETVWGNLLDGTSGIDAIRGFDPVNLPVKIAAEVLDFDPASGRTSTASAD